MRCLVGCKQSNKLYKKNYQTLQNWHNANPPLFFHCALPQLCDSVRPMVHYGVSRMENTRGSQLALCSRSSEKAGWRWPDSSNGWCEGSSSKEKASSSSAMVMSSSGYFCPSMKSASYGGSADGTGALWAGPRDVDWSRMSK